MPEAGKRIFTGRSGGSHGLCVCGAVRNEELENARGSAWKGPELEPGPARKIVPSPPGDAQGEKPRCRGRAGDGELEWIS